MAAAVPMRPDHLWQSRSDAVEMQRPLQSRCSAEVLHRAHPRRIAVSLIWPRTVIRTTCRTGTASLLARFASASSER